MKIAARRRLAVGVIATTSALLAGVLIAPASTAAPGGLSVNPSGVPNTATAQELTFTGTDADFRLGGEAVFTRVGGGAPFTVTIEMGGLSPSADRTGEGTKDFTDADDEDTSGNAVGLDGPADAGTYNVSATGEEDPTGTFGGGNDTCTSCFTVLSAGQVAVTSVAPNSLRPGNQGNVVVQGNNFERGSKIELLLGDGSVDTTITTANPPLDADGEPIEDGITTRTELQRRFNVGTGAQPGARDVRVTNLNGNTATCRACYFVAGASLTSSNPTAARNDPNQALTVITFTGPNVTNGTPRLEFVGTPGSASRSQLAIVGTNVREYTGTSITADFDLRNAAPGSNAYQPFVQGESGIVNACDVCRFTVLQDGRAPTLTSLDRSPDTAGTQKDLRQGETATFTATGTNFSKGVTLVFTPAAGLTVTGVEFVSPERFLVTIAAASDAPAENKNVQARLTDGQTSTACSACLTVTASAASPGPSTSASPGPSASTSASASPSASAGPRADARYSGLSSPARVLDTRSNRGTRQRGEIVLDLSQRISDANATAAVLNVTVTNPTARGFLVAYPNGTPKPGTSNVNFEAERAATSTTPASAGTPANEVIVGLPSSRRVSLFVDSASAHVIVDLVGFFTTTSSADTGRVTSNPPARALDSRSTSTPRRTGEVIVDLRDRLPAGATSAILNVTVQGPDKRGFVTVFPTGTSRPNTSNVNFERGQTQANEVVTRVGTGDNAGRVSLFIAAATTALIVDVVGAVTPGSTAGSQVYTALGQPTRAADTRQNRGARRSGAFDVAMPSSVPSSATGVVLNVTATNGTRSGFVTVYPAGQSNPGTSNVNFPGERAATSTTPASAGTQANEVISRLGSNRSVTLFVGGRDGVAAHVIVDVVGYLTETGAGAAASGSPRPSGSANPSASPACEEGFLPGIIGEECPTASAAPSASGSPRPSGAATASPTAAASVSPSPRPS